MDTNGADGLALTEVALCYMPIVVMAGPLPSLQLGVPVTNFCPPGGRALPRPQVVTCLTALATTWWWTTATRTKYSATIKSPSAMLTEHVLTIIVQIILRGNKSYRALFLL